MSGNAREQLISSLTKDELIPTLSNWRFWLRDEQLAPDNDWRIWLFLGGRGAGKTLAGAHFIEESVRLGRARRAGVIGATFNDTRAVMIEGESGLMKLCDGASFEPANRRIL